MSGEHHVAIVGGGFGGLSAALRLKRAPVQVTLIDRCNYHLFQPLLYQVATGALSPANIASPLRNVLKKQKNTRVLLGEAVGIDTAERRVILSDGAVDYDTLVVATGSSHQYFGHDEWAQFAPGLKTVEDATHMRRRILLAFEAAEREQNPEKLRAWMTFVIAGAGPTGVELAGTLGEIANDTLRQDFRHIRPSEARIILVEGSGPRAALLSGGAFGCGEEDARTARRHGSHRRDGHGHHERNLSPFARATRARQSPLARSCGQRECWHHRSDGFCPKKPARCLTRRDG